MGSCATAAVGSSVDRTTNEASKSCANEQNVAWSERPKWVFSRANRHQENCGTKIQFKLQYLNLSGQDPSYARIVIYLLHRQSKTIFLISNHLNHLVRWIQIQYHDVPWICANARDVCHPNQSIRKLRQATTATAMMALLSLSGATSPPVSRLRENPVGSCGPDHLYLPRGIKSPVCTCGTCNQNSSWCALPTSTWETINKNMVMSQNQTRSHTTLWYIGCGEELSDVLDTFMWLWDARRCVQCKAARVSTAFLRKEQKRVTRSGSGTIIVMNLSIFPSSTVDCRPGTGDILLIIFVIIKSQHRSIHVSSIQLRNQSQAFKVLILGWSPGGSDSNSAGSRKRSTKRLVSVLGSAGEECLPK